MAIQATFRAATSINSTSQRDAPTWWPTDRATLSARAGASAAPPNWSPTARAAIIWVDGNGGSREFQAGNGTTFVSPPNDLGTLVKNGNGTYTYTDPQQDKWNFNSQGQLTSIVQPDGPVADLRYNGSRRSDRA